jgi:eukaryotic-like serine/threonine-protein kinase
MVVSSRIPSGTILASKYQVIRELGRGGMAAVYEASNVDIGKRVAIKLLAGHLATSQTVVERFLREARAVTSIKSPHICDVYDSGRLDDGTPFLVMELLEGESLYDAMCRDRQMSPGLTLAIVLQVSRGLAKAHEATIVHRDLKPENVFLTVDDDGQLLVKILDFGLAKFYDPGEVKGKGGKLARLTRDGAVFGTPAYMSPEQVRGQAAADHRADLWALACITYECFTGTTVWSTDDGVAMTFAQIATAQLPDPRTYRPDLPESFTRWFHKALDRDIHGRFQSVKEFADELASAFNYNEKGGGLSASLVTKLTHLVSGGDPEATTVRRSSAGPPPPTPSAPVRTPPPTPSAQGRTPPPTPSARSAPVPMSQPVPSQPMSHPRPSPIADHRASGSPSPMELQRSEMPSLPSERPPRRLGTKIFGGLVLIGAVAAAIVVGRNTQVLEKPPPEARRFAPAAERLARTEPPETSGFKFVANHPWLPSIHEAQALIAQGEHTRALEALRHVWDKYRHGFVRNLMDQVQVAEAGKASAARCQVTGYARPRRYDLLGQDVPPVDATPPTIVRGLNQALMVWADSHEGQRRAYAVPLDDALRNRALPSDITPEGTRVDTPSILPVADRFLVAYDDTSGSAAGVYLRWLGADGVIAAPADRVTDHDNVTVSDAARTADGGVVVAWAEAIENDSVDLFFRRFGSDGKPAADAVRVTDFKSRGPLAARVREVRVVEEGGKLHFAYTFQRGSQQIIRYQSVAADVKAPGLDASDKGDERTLGEEVVVTTPTTSASEPSIACSKEGCYIAWTQVMQGGTGLAFIDKSGKGQWHKVFTTSGKHAAIATSPAGDVQIVWVEGGRLATATLDRSGLGPQSKIARVVGDHPPPFIAPGAKRGEWYVSWLDYESGHREPYAARIQCE